MDEVEVEIDLWEAIDEFLDECPYDDQGKNVKSLVSRMHSIFKKIPDRLIAEFPQNVKECVYIGMKAQVERWKPEESEER